MKKLLTADIVAGVRGLIGTKQSLEHLQEAYQEVITAIMKDLSGDVGGVVILHGCIDSDADATDWNISAGAAYYDGEVFEVPASGLLSHGSQVPVLSIITTYRAGDPVKFSDNNEFNVHAIRKLSWALGVSGSGLADFSAVKRLGNLKRDAAGVETGVILRTKVIEIGAWDMDGDASKGVNHGLGSGVWKKIRSISVIVRDDADNDYYDFTGYRAVLTPSGRRSGYASINSTQIQLVRLDSADGGHFDDNTFDSVSGPFNRGWITITYEE